MSAGGFRYAIIGAGAIGCALAGRLTAAWRDTTLVARGDRAELLRSEGVYVEESGKTLHAFPKVSAIGDLSSPDVLILSVKAQSLISLLPDLVPLIGPDTRVLPMVNGIPWWYFQGSGGAHDGVPVRAVDPDGATLKAIPADRLAGCVVYTTSRLEKGNHAKVLFRQRVVMGAVSRPNDDRLRSLADDMVDAGIDIDLTDRVRDDLWTKVAFNLSTNPFSVTTGATVGEHFTDPLLLSTVVSVLEECRAVAEAHGATPTLSIGQMVEFGKRAGPFFTSMRHDYLEGRPLELGSIFDAVAELAALASIAIPVSRTIADLARFHAAARPYQRSLS